MVARPTRPDPYRLPVSGYEMDTVPSRTEANALHQLRDGGIAS